MRVAGIPLGVMAQKSAAPGGPLTVFHTTFVGVQGETAVVDTTGRHSPTLINCSIVDVISGYGAYDGDSSLLMYNGSGAGTERMRVDGSSNADFIWDGDFDLSFYGLTEDTLTTERVLMGNADSDTPTLGANQYNRLTVRHLPSTKNLRLYAGSTLIASGTADFRNVWGKVGVRRLGSSLTLRFNDTQVGSAVTYSGTIGGGFLNFGGFSNSNKARLTYFDLIRVTKG